MDKSPICPFNNLGFCKYKDKCKKKHLAEKCLNRKCERKCSKRHPKLCKYGESCRCKAKGVCAYDHDIIANKEEFIDMIKNIEEEKYSEKKET